MSLATEISSESVHTRTEISSDVLDRIHVRNGYALVVHM